jgi:hypothetical protein
MTARAFLGAGDLYLARQVSGVFEEYTGPFECSKFEIKPNVQLREQTSKGRSTYGQVIETVALQQPADLSVDLTEVNKETLAIALLGTTAALSQTSGTLTDEVVTAKLDKWVVLSKAAFNEASFTLKNSAGSTTYVKGVDYILNAQLGWFKALTGGAITEAQSLKASGPYLAITGTEIKGATQAQLRVRFKLDGKNFADDTPCIVTVHEAVIAADAAFDFLSDNFATVTMPGRMKTPSGMTEPFNVHLRNA